MLETRALEKGSRGRAFITHSTARKARTLFTNLYTASPYSGADVTFAGPKNRYHATTNPSQSYWFENFSRGFRIRVGVATRQDRAYTLPLLHEMVRRCEDHWEESDGEPTLTWISAVMFLLASCLGGMRGYEVVWADLSALIHDVEKADSSDEEPDGVGWPIVGRFKAEGGGIGGHVIPIAARTNSGLEFFKWTQRFVRIVVEHGRTEGWAFARDDGSRASARDYREVIFGLLEDIQEERPDLIEPECDVHDAFGIQRSGRRFFDTECRLRGVKKEDIEAQCRWIKDRQARGVPVPRDMVELYSEFRHLCPVLLRPSQAL